jgi:hypothetical protein
MDHGGLWGLATILGPLVLLAALVYGVMMHRKRGPVAKALTEETTRELYRKGAERERVREGG